MRMWFSGPRIMGIRPGISLGREDFRNLAGSYTTRPMRTDGITAAPRVKEAMLYVVQGDHGRSKIGISSDPNARLAQLKTGSPFPISLATVYAPSCDSMGALRIEQAAHAMLTAHRCEGEWFDVEPAIAGAAISAAAIQQGINLCQIDAATAAKVTEIVAMQTLFPVKKSHSVLWTIAKVIWSLVGILVLISIIAIMTKS